MADYFPQEKNRLADSILQKGSPQIIEVAPEPIFEQVSNFNKNAVLAVDNLVRLQEKIIAMEKQKRMF